MESDIDKLKRVFMHVTQSAYVTMAICRALFELQDFNDPEFKQFKRKFSSVRTKVEQNIDQNYRFILAMFMSRAI